jgi:GrpB-like predicted nucleotidyltransferase (UPF0157 family)
VEDEPPVVDVVAWSPHWAGAFERARTQLLPVLPPGSTVEHIGSTSVPGLPAKPVIDILVTTEKIDDLRADLRGLEALGYRYNPKYFADDPDRLFLRRDTDGHRTEHLHIFHPRSPMPTSNRAFRDFLSANESAAQRYAEAKRTAARTHPSSRAAYGQAKEQTLQQLLAEARAWAADASNGD